jgi:hypothetical protein
LEQTIMTNTTHTLPTLVPNMEEHGGALIFINGRKCSFSSVRSYTMYNNVTYGENEDLDEAVARAASKHHPLYWITLHGSVLCGDPGFYDREAARWANAPQVQAGDIVEYEGKQFKITPTWNNNFNPIPV